ncbi:MAG: hypothetical protein ACKV2T_39080 [Kofleriaceae bacterium]
MRRGLCAVIACAGCSYSSLDDEIFPELLGAEVAVESAAPTDAAIIDVRLALRGGPTASADAVIDRIVLEDPAIVGSQAELLELAVGFPAGFDAYIGGSETKVVDLENHGTTNAELAGLCGSALTMRLYLADADEPNTWWLATRPVTVACN